MLYAAVFIVGLLFGSFLNVCIYRIPRGESVVFDGSRCPSCERPIKPNDLIPLLSFLWLKGRCRQCKQPISIRYPLVELLNGALYMLCYHTVGLSWQLIVLAGFCSTLIVISGIDLDTKEIPNGLVLTVILLAFANIWLDDTLTWTQAAIGFFAASVPMLMLAVITNGGMGGGDIKLMAAAGLFLGWLPVVTALFIACIIAGVIGIVLIAAKIKKGKDMIPFGPYLSLGLLIALFYGDSILRWYVQFSGLN